MIDRVRYLAGTVTDRDINYSRDGRRPHGG